MTDVRVKQWYTTIKNNDLSILDYMNRVVPKSVLLNSISDSHFVFTLDSRKFCWQYYDKMYTFALLDSGCSISLNQVIQEGELGMLIESGIELQNRIEDLRHMNYERQIQEMV